MTIYMVQHVFCRPEWEQEWNAWYGENLKVLLAVRGFRSGQRFRAVGARPSRYMAVYTVDSPAVFESEEYLQAGGNGANSVRFRPAYQGWIRNLFEGIEVAPAVGPGQYLVAVDSADQNVEIPGIDLAWLQASGFHKSTPYRGLAVVGQERLHVLRERSDAVVYEPLTGQQAPLYA